MFKLFKSVVKNSRNVGIIKKRSFLSYAYYCDEVWQKRLQNPLTQKINLDELYNDLDQRYQKIGNVSAVDVNIFAHAVKDDSYCEELLDLIHKLRISADSSNTLHSTSHAVVKYLTQINKTQQLLDILDDRLNYGIFLDNYTANLLLDTFWKKQDFTSGVRVVGQLMLQEELNDPISSSLSLLICYKFLSNPSEWPQSIEIEEPKEEVKVRVNYLRNAYDDEHFDLRDPFRIVGKSLMYITKNSLQNTLYRSFYLLGLTLFKPDLAKKFLENVKKSKEEIFSDVLKLIPNDERFTAFVHNTEASTHNIEGTLQNIVKSSVSLNSEKDIAIQCQKYVQWEEEQKKALERQHVRLQILNRLSNIENSQKELKEKEMPLWFFENEEKIELEIEAKKIRKIDCPQNTKMLHKDYISPELHKGVN